MSAFKHITIFGMSPPRVIKNTNCQQNGGRCVESTEDPKWISKIIRPLPRLPYGTRYP